MTDRCSRLPSGQQPYVEPRNELERAVATIWAELLKLETAQVGVDDNFLLLGGESLLATQASARLQEQFGCTVETRSIFVNTVGEVAEELARHGVEGSLLRNVETTPGEP